MSPPREVHVRTMYRRLSHHPRPPQAGKYPSHESQFFHPLFKELHQAAIDCNRPFPAPSANLTAVFPPPSQASLRRQVLSSDNLEMPNLSSSSPSLPPSLPPPTIPTLSNTTARHGNMALLSAPITINQKANQWNKMHKNQNFHPTLRRQCQ